MSAAPIPGTIERIAMIVPQNAAPSMPATPECETRKRTLNNADYERSLDGRTSDRRKSLQHERLVLVTQRHVIENFLQDFLAVFEKEKHRINHDKEIQKKSGRGSRHSRCHCYQKASDGFRSCADTLDQLFLAWHVIRQGRKPLHEPIVCVESAGSAEVLLHPRNRLIAHGQCLLHDHSEKCTQWPSHDNEKNHESDDRTKRSPTSEQPRNPLIKWVA